MNPKGLADNWGCLGSSGIVILSPWLFLSFVRWMLLYNIKTCILLNSLIGLPTCIFSRPFYSQLSNLSPSRPQFTSQAVHHFPWVNIDPNLRSLFFPYEVDEWVHCPWFCTWGGFPLVAPFWVRLLAELYCRISPFSSSTYILSQHRSGFLPPSLVVRETWAPAEVQFWADHFHLSVDCCGAHLILRSDGLREPSSSWLGPVTCRSSELGWLFTWVLTETRPLDVCSPYRSSTM